VFAADKTLLKSSLSGEDIVRAKFKTFAVYMESDL